MKIDEQEFRSFIANVKQYMGKSTYQEDLNDPQLQDWCRLEINIWNKLNFYQELLETPKLSKWKQLKIEGI